MTRAPETAVADASAAPSWAGRNVHFLIAVAVLAAATGWWQFAKNYLQWALQKQAVPWPAAVRVGDDFRLLSLPEKIGPLVLAEGGEQILPEDIRTTLGVGTGYDRTRYGSRSSNWYVVRVYRDTRMRDSRAPYALWQLSVTYYTGAMDTVPHVPGVCLAQAGHRIIAIDTAEFHVPAARDGWDRPMKVVRTQFEKPGIVSEPQMEYSLFSLNGRPEHSWVQVRAELAKPWVRHCYFASITFSPLCAVRDVAEADRQAGEFLNLVLPATLEALPSPQDVQGAAAGG